MLRAGVQGDYFNYTARAKGPPTQVPAEDEGSPPLWRHCCAPPVYQNSHQEHKPDQWTHTDLKYSEERRQQSLKWGTAADRREYRRLRVRVRVALRFLRTARRLAAFARESRRTGTFPNPSQQPVILAHPRAAGLGFLRPGGCSRVTLRRRSPSSSQLRQQPSLAGWSLIEARAPAATELWAC